MATAKKPASDATTAPRARKASAPPAAAPEPPRRARGRAALAVVLVVVGALLAPTSAALAWTARTANDTDTFVSTLAPLSDDPAVQALIVDRSTLAIDEALGTDALIADLLDGLVNQEERPILGSAADALGPLLADQARAAIHSAMEQVVASDAFDAVWVSALTATHRNLVRVLGGSDNGAVVIDNSGVVSIELGPIIAALKPALAEAGFGLANAIPPIDASIEVAEVQHLAQVRVAYATLITSGQVFPWITLLLMVAGILLHPRRRIGVLVAGSLLGAVGLALLLSIAGAGRVVAAVLASTVPLSATQAIYSQVTHELRAVMAAMFVVGVVAVIAALIAGPGTKATAVRRWGENTVNASHRALDAKGWVPPAMTRVLRSSPWLLWVLLGLVFVALYATIRPLTPWDVAWSSLLIGIVAAAFAVLHGPRASLKK